MADDGGAIVGAATIVDSRRHAMRYGLVLDVAPGHRRSGVGSALLAAARNLTAGEPRPFRIQVHPGDHVSVAFLTHHRFRALARTWVGWLDRVDTAATGRAEPLPAGCRILRTPDVDRLALARALFRWYQSAHAWDPPTAWPDRLIVDHFAGPDLVPESEVAVVEAGVVLGAATLIRPPLGGDHLYLAHLGPVDPSHVHGEQVTATLLGACLERAAHLGKPIQFEVDDSNRILWDLLAGRGLPVLPMLLTAGSDALPTS